MSQPNDDAASPKNPENPDTKDSSVPSPSSVDAPKVSEEDLRAAANFRQLQEAKNRLLSNPNDDEAKVSILKGLGFTDEQIEEARQQVTGGKEPKTVETPKPTSPPVPSKIGYNQLDPKIQKTLDEIAEQNFQNEVTTAIQADEVLASLDKESPEVRKLVREKVEQACLVGKKDAMGVRRVVPYGPQVLQDALKEVKGTLEKISKTPTGQRLGVGRAPGASNTRNVEKPVERVSSKSKNFQENFLKRLEQYASR